MLGACLSTQETIEGMETWALHLVAAAVAKPGDKDADAGRRDAQLSEFPCPNLHACIHPDVRCPTYSTHACPPVQYCAGTWLPMATTLLAPSPLLAMQPPAVQLAYMTGACITVAAWVKRAKGAASLLGHPQARGLVLTLRGCIQALSAHSQTDIHTEQSLRGYLQDLAQHVTECLIERVTESAKGFPGASAGEVIVTDIFNVLKVSIAPLQLQSHV